jgi:hypothetical protein
MSDAVIIFTCILIVLGFVAAVVLAVWLSMYPATSDAVLVTNPDDGKEGLFSRITSWVGAGMYAEDHGASGLVLTSIDYRKMYTTSGCEDLCPRLLATAAHELVPGGLGKRRVHSGRKFGFGDQLWTGVLRNSGMPCRPSRPWLEMQRLFHKYARFRPEFEHSAADFWQAHIPENSFVVGVHWRGTDRKTGSKCFKASDFISRVKDVLALGPLDQTRIVFVASDEAAFVESCRQEFAGSVVTQEMERAREGGSALHMAHDRDPEANGRAVILDALLLSRCQHLVKGRSFVSDYSLFWNPHMACDLFNNQTGERWAKSAGTEGYFVKRDRT